MLQRIPEWQVEKNFHDDTIENFTVTASSIEEASRIAFAIRLNDDGHYRKIVEIKIKEKR